MRRAIFIVFYFLYSDVRILKYCVNIGEWRPLHDYYNKIKLKKKIFYFNNWRKLWVILKSNNKINFFDVIFLIEEHFFGWKVWGEQTFEGLNRCWTTPTQAQQPGSFSTIVHLSFDNNLIFFFSLLLMLYFNSNH